MDEYKLGNDTIYLGKLEPEHDDRTLMLANYLDSEQLALSYPVPPALRWGNHVKRFPVLSNDKMGNCVFASDGHARILWQTIAGHQVTVTEQEIVNAYAAATGYDPRTGRNDNGANMLQALKWFRKNPIGGSVIDAFAAIEPGNDYQVKLGMSIFGGVYCGVALPKSGQGQMNNGQPWTVVSGPSARPGTWGGHAMGAFSYDADWIYYTTWGRVQKASWSWFQKYCVAPATKVLTADLHWVPIKDIRVGQALLGFDENPPLVMKESGMKLARHRRWRPSIVESLECIEQPCFDIILEDGTLVQCSGDHLWLVRRGNNLGWQKTSGLRWRGRPYSRIVKPLSVWRNKQDWNNGYLAAAFDGEGHLTQRDLSRDKNRPFSGVRHLCIGFCQKVNPMMAQVVDCLNESSFTFHPHKVRENGVQVLTISRRPHVMEFLGRVRPRRLMAKFDASALGSIMNAHSSARRVIDVVDVGVKPVIAMKTSTGTFLAEGLASHNCDECYIKISSQWSMPSGQAPSGFAYNDLLQDVSKI